MIGTVRRSLLYTWEDVDNRSEEVKVMMMNVTSTVYGEPCNPVLQPLWQYMKAGQEEILLSPYLLASFGFLTHVLFCAPFLVLDALGSVCERVQGWRIAAGSGPPPPLRRWYDCFWRLLFKYLTTILPATAVVQMLRSPNLPDLAPSCWQLFVDVFACFLLFDTLFYIWHIMMHRWAVCMTVWFSRASTLFLFIMGCRSGS